MNIYERYKIAIQKAEEVKRMNFSEKKKEEIYSNLGSWIDSGEKELPFPFGKTPRKF